MKKILLQILTLIFISLSFQTYAGDKIWDLNIDTDYVLSDTDTSMIYGGLGKLKLQLTHEGNITDGTDGTELDQTQGIVVIGNYAYMTSRSSNALEIIDISDPSNPSHVGSIVDGGDVTLRRSQDLVVDGDYAYITANRDDAIEIVDISDPTSPTHISSIVKSSTIQLDGAIGIEKVGDYLYIVSNSDDALEILDVSDPANPSHVSALTDGTRLNGAEDIKIVGDYAYITAEGNDSFEIVDISDPSNPSFVGELEDGTDGATLNGASGIAINGDYAYIAANADDAIEIINISDPSNPSHISSITNGGDILLDGVENIQISGNFAYIASTSSDAIAYNPGPSCANPDDIIHDASLVEGSPVEYNTTWQKTNSGDPCYFTCEDEWKGNLCDIEKEWFDYDSNCNQSDIKITVLDGTEQTWAGCNSTLGTGTGFHEGDYADSDDSRACKNYDGGVTDDDRLKCFSETDYTKKEIDYFDIVQSDGENDDGDKGFDTIWGKMYLWSDLDNNCINPSGGDFHGSDNDYCACLDGWHVPTYSEYKDLLDKIADNNKKQTDWAYIGWKYNNGKVDSNHSGALDSNFVSLLKVPLSGYARENDGAGLTRGQYFHLLTANNTNSSLYSHDDQQGVDKSNDKDDYYSVRCIKD